MQEEKKEEHMDVAEDLYVASDLYEEDDVETGIRLGASPVSSRAGAAISIADLEFSSHQWPSDLVPLYTTTRHAWAIIAGRRGCRRGLRTHTQR